MRSTLSKLAFKAKRTFEFSILAVLIGLGVAGQTQPVAFQDMASAVGTDSENRWLVHVKAGAGESIARLGNDENSAKLLDPAITNSITSAAIVSEKVKLGPTPETINRSIKGNRVVQTTARSAPKDFSAGSVLERQSFLESLDTGKKFALEFVKPKSHEEAFQVASLFHPPKPKHSDIPQNLPVAVASLVKQSESSVLAYVPEEKPIHSPFAAVLVDPQPVKLLPKLNDGDHAWADDPLPINSFSKKQQNCLARGIYFEARGEPVEGQAAVAQVILNRVRNPHYPNSICGVVYQNKHWHNRCQFSFACDRIRDLVRNRKLFDIAEHVAAETTAGRIWLKEVGSSTHYHATYVNPRWNRRMKRVGKIGLHIFYRTYGGGWS